MNQEFSVNSTFLFGVAIVVILFVLAQSFFFLFRALKRGKEIGMEQAKLRKTIVSTAIFTIAPAISILLGVITLAKFLGIPLPWIRMSVIGAITYELPAATSTANAIGVSLSDTITHATDYTAIAWVMTLGILPSIVLVPILIKKIQKGIVKIRSKDGKWGEIFMSALFLGMISAFLGMVFADIRSGLVGYIPIFVLLFSALIMGVCGILVKKCNMKWLETYAISFSMLGGMIFSVIITALITG